MAASLSFSPLPQNPLTPNPSPPKRRRGERKTLTPDPSPRWGEGRESWSAIAARGDQGVVQQGSDRLVVGDPQQAEGVQVLPGGGFALLVGRGNNAPDALEHDAAAIGDALVLLDASLEHPRRVVAVRALLANPEDDSAIGNHVRFVVRLDELLRTNHRPEKAAPLGGRLRAAVPDDLLALGQLGLDQLAVPGRNLFRIVGQPGAARRGGLGVGSVLAVASAAARAAVLLDVAVGRDDVALLLVPALLVGCLALLLAREALAAEQLVDDWMQQLLADHLLDVGDVAQRPQAAPGGVLKHVPRKRQVAGLLEPLRVSPRHARQFESRIGDQAELVPGVHHNGRTAGAAKEHLRTGAGMNQHAAIGQHIASALRSILPYRAGGLEGEEGAQSEDATEYRREHHAENDAVDDAQDECDSGADDHQPADGTRDQQKHARLVQQDVNARAVAPDHALALGHLGADLLLHVLGDLLVREQFLSPATRRRAALARRRSGGFIGRGRRGRRSRDDGLVDFEPLALVVSRLGRRNLDVLADLGALDRLARQVRAGLQFLLATGTGHREQVRGLGRRLGGQRLGCRGSRPGCGRLRGGSGLCFRGCRGSSRRCGADHLPAPGALDRLSDDLIGDRQLALATRAGDNNRHDQLPFEKDNAVWLRVEQRQRDARQRAADCTPRVSRRPGLFSHTQDVYEDRHRALQREPSPARKSGVPTYERGGAGELDSATGWGRHSCLP